ncbi:hypothetical protein GCM10017083_49560 [Thalassobaculum fulvum]|uniref:Uncharacterized protein n=1 Tax=Thalassobaculum fulvum TaxID=1633335 RepID=A0A918XX38_9PROT|nr:hypothetical protein [Thalassobaculum fulvum]GHD61762.1 hypothetical protein GCM10017083_49560 [Thalassobaculum fulvum]
MAQRPTRGHGRTARRPRLIDRIVDYPYRRLFGVKGCSVIALVVLAAVAIRYTVGIGTVTLDPMTCRLAWTDAPYKPFFKERILQNTRRELGRQVAEKQKALWDIRAGRDPFPAKASGNVAGIRRIDNDKFFWRAYAQNLETEIAAISDCLRRLPGYRFD